MKTFFLFIIFYISNGGGKIPEGYIMTVMVHCGHAPSGAAVVHVVTDLQAEVRAECYENTIKFLNTTDKANFYIDAFYPNSSVNSSEYCLFKKRVDVQTYFMEVITAFSEPGGEVYNDEEIFTVACTFDPKGNNGSSQNIISGRLIAPFEVQYNEGPETSSKLNLTLADVEEGHLSAGIDIGRKVMLLASTDGSSGEQGLRITACNAVGASTGTRYQIIRAGCGDGFVFRQDEGFVTSGLAAVSPYFSMFHLYEDKVLQFECNFTLCATTCDGSSCSNNRRRRDEQEFGEANVLTRSMKFDVNARPENTVDITNIVVAKNKEIPL